MKVGINLHLHTNDDPRDKIRYSFTEALDESLKNGIKITAITCHDKFIDYQEYKDEAAKRGMLLIPGIEKTIKNFHVLILNCDKKIEEVDTLEKLREYKISNPKILIIAPHPFVFIASIGNKLIKNHDIFDAIELTWFYSESYNTNKKAMKVANLFNLPFIASSDAHVLNMINICYSEIEVENLTIESVFKSIRNNNFRNITRPQKIWFMIKYIIKAKLNLR